ncbi:MAG: MOSC domain-containing protein [Candidatus Aenigmarchaeota archaeon]|nr:MOSC domain-containing protein [Candidatus Aenigmarchaeota archaeon]
MIGQVHQVNVKPQLQGERGLPKNSMASAYLTYCGLADDFNRYRHEKKNDDPDMALLLMPLEAIGQLNSEGWPVQPGDIGENITTVGIPYDNFQPGRIYRVGGAKIQISEKCDPCSNLYLLPFVGKERGPHFLKTMLNRRGWYARVLQEGLIAKGDAILYLNHADL